MSVRSVVAGFVFIGMAVFGARANATVMTISAQACHQLYQSDVSKISYNVYGVTSDQYTATGMVYLNCPMVRTPQAANTSQAFYVDGLHYDGNQTTNCTLTLLDWNYSIKYQEARSFSSTAYTTWEMYWSVAAAQATTWTYASVQCRVPAYGKGMLFGLASN